MRLTFDNPNTEAYKDSILELSQDCSGAILLKGKYSSFIKNKKVLPEKLIDSDIYNFHLSNGIELGKKKGVSDNLIIEFYFQIVVNNDSSFAVFARSISWVIFREGEIVEKPRFLQNGDIIVLSRSITGEQDLKSIYESNLEFYPKFTFECSSQEIETVEVAPEATDFTPNELIKNEAPPEKALLGKKEHVENKLEETEKSLKPLKENKKQSKVIAQKPKPQSLKFMRIILASILLLCVFGGYVFFDNRANEFLCAIGLKSCDPSDPISEEMLFDDNLNDSRSIDDESQRTVKLPELLAKVDQQLVDIDIRITQGNYDEAKRMIEECKSLLATIPNRDQSFGKSRFEQLNYFESVISPIEDDEQL